MQDNEKHVVLTLGVHDSTATPKRFLIESISPASWFKEIWLERFNRPDPSTPYKFYDHLLDAEKK